MKPQKTMRAKEDNNTRGRTPRTSENMSNKSRQNARENAWKRKWQCKRERTMKKQCTQEWKWEREAKNIRVKTSGWVKTGSTTSVLDF